MNELPVVISGTSSGFGRACAVFLSENGFLVFLEVQNKSGENIFQKNTVGKIAPLLLDVLDTISGKSLSSFNEVMSKPDNAGTHLISDLNIPTAGYFFSYSSIPSEKVANPVHQTLISNKPQNRYLLGKDAIFFKMTNFLRDIFRIRMVLNIMKI